MEKKRILIVNDAVVIRRLVAGLLAEDPALEVVGTAANGRIALAKIDQLRPDLVLLDVEMPEMDGLETLAALGKSHPQVPVIMLSRFTRKGSPTTLDALFLGARDYVPIPEETHDKVIQQLREQLLTKIKLFCFPPASADTVTRKMPNAAGRSRSRTDFPACPKGDIEVVAIATSTGGPNALTRVLGGLPHDFPVPLLIVQHMPATFTPLLARRLSAQCPIPVVEAQSGDVLSAGKAWLAPGDFHLVLSRLGTMVKVRTHQEVPENSCRPSADVLFRSAADTFGPGVLAVVLTGMGQDGLRGCERIRERGGQILAQDEATSVVWGMPGYIARAGLADLVLPLDQMGPEIVRRVGTK